MIKSIFAAFSVILSLVPVLESSFPVQFMPENASESNNHQSRSKKKKQTLLCPENNEFENFLKGHHEYQANRITNLTSLIKTTKKVYVEESSIVSKQLILSRALAICIQKYKNEMDHFSWYQDTMNSALIQGEVIECLIEIQFLSLRYHPGIDDDSALKWYENPNYVNILCSLLDKSQDEYRFSAILKSLSIARESFTIHEIFYLALILLRVAHESTKYIRDFKYSHHHHHHAIKSLLNTHNNYCLIKSFFQVIGVRILAHHRNQTFSNLHQSLQNLIDYANFDYSLLNIDGFYIVVRQFTSIAMGAAFQACNVLGSFFNGTIPVQTDHLITYPSNGSFSTYQDKICFENLNKMLISLLNLYPHVDLVTFINHIPIMNSNLDEMISMYMDPSESAALNQFFSNAFDSVKMFFTLNQLQNFSSHTMQQFTEIFKPPLFSTMMSVEIPNGLFFKTALTAFSWLLKELVYVLGTESGEFGSTLHVPSTAHPMLKASFYSLMASISLLKNPQPPESITFVLKEAYDEFFYEIYALVSENQSLNPKKCIESAFRALYAARTLVIQYSANKQDLDGDFAGLGNISKTNELYFLYLVPVSAPEIPAPTTFMDQELSDIQTDDDDDDVNETLLKIYTNSNPNILLESQTGTFGVVNSGMVPQNCSSNLPNNSRYSTESGCTGSRPECEYLKFNTNVSDVTDAENGTKDQNMNIALEIEGKVQLVCDFKDGSSTPRNESMTASSINESFTDQEITKIGCQIVKLDDVATKTEITIDVASKEPEGVLESPEKMSDPKGSQNDDRLNDDNEFFLVRGSRKKKKDRQFTKEKIDSLAENSDATTIESKTYESPQSSMREGEGADPGKNLDVNTPDSINRDTFIGTKFHKDNFESNFSSNPHTKEDTKTRDILNMELESALSGNPDHMLNFNELKNENSTPTPKKSNMESKRERKSKPEDIPVKQKRLKEPEVAASIGEDSKLYPDTLMERIREASKEFLEIKFKRKSKKDFRAKHSSYQRGIDALIDVQEATKKLISASEEHFQETSVSLNRLMEGSSQLSTLMSEETLAKQHYLCDPVLKNCMHLFNLTLPTKDMDLSQNLGNEIDSVFLIISKEYSLNNGVMFDLSLNLLDRIFRELHPCNKLLLTSKERQECISSEDGCKLRQAYLVICMWIQYMDQLISSNETLKSVAFPHVCEVHELIKQIDLDSEDNFRTFLLCSTILSRIVHEILIIFKEFAIQITEKL